MAEIKSTLDLVMEKTKNLSLSNEEKLEQKNKEIESRIRGLLQKFTDQALSAGNFKSEYQKLQKNHDLSVDLLAEFKVSDFEGLSSVLQEFQAVRDTAARERRKIVKEQLAKTHFISGSAVVPNLEVDDEWREKTGQIRAEFEAKLNQAKTKLLAG
jgi:hypothetical protein